MQLGDLQRDLPGEGFIGRVVDLIEHLRMRCQIFHHEHEILGVLASIREHRKEFGRTDGHLGCELAEEADLLDIGVGSKRPVPLFLIALWVLPPFVRTRARYYSEVFFRLLEEEA